MVERRIATVLLSLVLAGGLAACGSDDDSGGSGSGDEESSTPVDLGSVNDEGTDDLGSGMTATLDLDAGDNAFSPTFIRAAPGAKVTVRVTNSGSASHTFTIEGTSIDEKLEAGASAEAEVTVPDDGALEFVCRFHGAAGMRGAFYSADGQAVTNAAAGNEGTDATVTSSAGGLYR
jgi:plastocyanin